MRPPLCLLVLGGFVLLAGLAARPAAAQPLRYDGEVASVAARTVVQLAQPLAVPRGSLVYAYEPVDVGGTGVGRLTGAFRVLEADSLRLVVIPTTPGVPEGVRPGQPVEVDLSAPPSLVEVGSSPPGARVSWAGIPLGVTPTEIQFAAGTYTLLFEAEGFGLTPLEVEVEPDRIIGVSTTLLPPERGQRP